MSYTRKSYSGIAAATTLNGDITNASTSITLAASTGWPDGSNGPFHIRIESETILIASRSGNTLTVTTRGYDGTTAASHTSGVAITHVFAATDADEANYAVSKTVAKVTGAGMILIGDAANSMVGLDIKGDGKLVIGNGTTATSQAVSGDVTLTNAGVTAIGANKITKAMVVNTARYKEVTFSKSGVLTTGTGTFRWYPTADTTIVDVWASVATSNTGATLICDINNSGTTIFTTQSRRPTIAISGHYAASGVPDGDVTLVGGTDYVTVDIDQVGSTIAGSDLVVGIRYYET